MTCYSWSYFSAKRSWSSLNKTTAKMKKLSGGWLDASACFTPKVITWKGFTRVHWGELSCYLNGRVGSGKPCHWEGGIWQALSLSMLCTLERTKSTPEPVIPLVDRHKLTYLVLTCRKTPINQSTVINSTYVWFSIASFPCSANDFTLSHTAHNKLYFTTEFFKISF